MRFFDDPGKALQQMGDELLEEDWEEDEEDVDGDGEDFPVLTRRDSRPTNYAVDFDRTVYDDEETDDAYYAEDYIADRKSRKKQRKKGSGGLVLLLLGGMPLFDSLCTAFGTAGTGGFGIRADSIAPYSPYIQGVITVFMILCGINFNLYYLLLLRQWRAALRSDELWTYLGLAVVATGVITLDLRGVYGGLGTCLRQAAFQVSSVLTTTGYATADFDLWPGLSRAILFALLFIGGCAGSTAGGLKVSRAMILLRTIRREVNRLVHPRRVTAVRCDGKALSSEVQRGVSIYFALYCLCILITFLCLSGEPFSLETNLSAVVSCFNNVGPGLGAVGPAGSYAGYSVLSKLLLSAAMLMGRLEIYPMLVALSPSVWRKD